MRIESLTRKLFLVLRLMFPVCNLQIRLVSTLNDMVKLSQLNSHPCTVSPFTYFSFIYYLMYPRYIDACMMVTHAEMFFFANPRKNVIALWFSDAGVMHSLKLSVRVDFSISLYCNHIVFFDIISKQWNVCCSRLCILLKQGEVISVTF